MHIVYSNHPLPTSITKSIFMAGPSPRSLQETDWRHDALKTLADLGFDGTVFVPVPDYRFERNQMSDAENGWNYLAQVTWEVEARKMADIIAFWLARDIDRSKEDLGMPGFVTNFEMGEDLHSGKIAYGRPPTAPKCRYMDKRIEELGQPAHATMTELFTEVMTRLGDGALRTGGEAYVPLLIWRLESFQGWYTNLQKAGNRLDGADLLNVMVVGGKHVFSFMLKVNVWIAAEQRHKTNEFIFARKDISTIFAFHRSPTTGLVHVALVREFRSPVSNETGYVYELAGGSAVKANVDPQENAQHELEEELGLHIADAKRFQYIGQRQLASTLSVHRAQLYAVALTTEEFETLSASVAAKTVFGVVEDSERTFVELTTLDQLLTVPLDYSMLGMVYEAAIKLGLTH